MITPQDLQEAIAYRNGKVDPDPMDAVFLAACHYLQDRETLLSVQTMPQAAEPPETYQRYSGAESAAREPTLALDGDTEFERAIMSMPIDWDHMERLIHVFTIHMENLAFANKRAYNKIIDQIEQIARS